MNVLEKLNSHSFFLGVKQGAEEQSHRAGPKRENAPFAWSL